MSRVDVRKKGTNITFRDTCPPTPPKGTDPNSAAGNPNQCNCNSPDTCWYVPDFDGAPPGGAPPPGGGGPPPGGYAPPGNYTGPPPPPPSGPPSGDNGYKPPKGTPPACCAKVPKNGCYKKLPGYGVSGFNIYPWEACIRCPEKYLTYNQNEDKTYCTFLSEYLDASNLIYYKEEIVKNYNKIYDTLMLFENDLNPEYNSPDQYSKKHKSKLKKKH